MKKAILKGDYGYVSQEAETIGFVPNYMWKSVKYFRGPKKHGQYLTINKKGKIRKLSFTGTFDVDKSLFDTVANNEYVYVNDTPITDEQCMSIYRSPWERWYFVDECYCDDCPAVMVLTEDSPMYPLYFLDLNLEDNIPMDKNGEIVTDEPPQNYVLKDGDYFPVY